MSLIFRDISHKYGATTAVSKANLEASPGEIVCLFGPSGCGKTTLLRLAAGLEPVQSGAIELDGALISSPDDHVPAERRPVGLVFQDYVLFPHMTVAQNVEFGIQHLSKKEKNRRIDAQLVTLGLTEFRDRYPHMLSGGQQQRVALARAFVRQPKAMLLDEPFASIDAVRRRALRENLRLLLKTQDTASVLVTHDPDEALAIGDKIAIMKSGRIIETATPKKLFEAPQTVEGASLFPGAQILSGEASSGMVRTGFGSLRHEIGDGIVTVVFMDGACMAKADPAGNLEVTDCRFMGPDWRVVLAGENPTETLDARCPGPIEIGHRARVDIDPNALRLFSVN